MYLRRKNNTEMCSKGEFRFLSFLCLSFLVGGFYYTYFTQTPMKTTCSITPLPDSYWECWYRVPSIAAPRMYFVSETNETKIDEKSCKKTVAFEWISHEYNTSTVTFSGSDMKIEKECYSTSTHLYPSLRSAQDSLVILPFLVFYFPFCIFVYVCFSFFC